MTILFHRLSLTALGRAVIAPLVWAALTAFSHAAGAAQLTMEFPLRCNPGQDCWVGNYVDVDPSDGHQDFACGPRTYNKHKGTDIAIRDMEAMRRGVVVIAATGGQVLGTRDGMDDINIRSLGGPAALNGKDCGNGVLVGHPGGWRTQYCHMRKGSIAVNRGDVIKTGQPLGLVGLSGRTEYPHLHIQVTFQKDIVDPFVGLERTSRCGPGPRPLWSERTQRRLPYRPAAIYTAGFATGAPKPDAARDGRHYPTTIGRNAPALVLWADIFGVRKGDVLRIRITGPGSRTILQRRVPMKKTLARFFAYSGKKKKSGLWPPGAYLGDIQLLRKSASGGIETFELRRQVTVR